MLNSTRRPNPMLALVTRYFDLAVSDRAADLNRNANWIG